MGVLHVVTSPRVAGVAAAAVAMRTTVLSVPSDSVNIIISVECKLSTYPRKHRPLPSIPSPEVQKQRFTEHV